MQIKKLSLGITFLFLKNNETSFLGKSLDYVKGGGRNEGVRGGERAEKWSWSDRLCLEFIMNSVKLIRFYFSKSQNRVNTQAVDNFWRNKTTAAALCAVAVLTSLMPIF